MVEWIIWRISVGTVAELILLIISVGAVLSGILLEKRRDRAIAKREIYQRLELASIDLFRFEADHLDLIRPLYTGEDAASDPAMFHAYQNYVCQILNLFEMSVELFCEGVIEEQVFRSWIAWFRETGQAPGFASLWNGGLRDNYTGRLARIMDLAAGVVSDDFPEQVMTIMRGQRK